MRYKSLICVIIMFVMIVAGCKSTVAMNPDVILRFTHADPETSKKMFEKEFKENPVWTSLEAVKNNQVYDLDPNYFGVVANIRCADSLYACDPIFKLCKKYKWEYIINYKSGSIPSVYEDFI